MDNISHKGKSKHSYTPPFKCHHILRDISKFKLLICKCNNHFILSLKMTLWREKKCTNDFILNLFIHFIFSFFFFPVELVINHEVMMNWSNRASISLLIRERQWSDAKNYEMMCIHSDMSVTHKASSQLSVKLIQFDCIMGFSLRFLLPEDCTYVLCVFSDILDGYGFCTDGKKCVTDILYEQISLHTWLYIYHLFGMMFTIAYEQPLIKVSRLNVWNL